MYPHFSSSFTFYFYYTLFYVHRKKKSSKFCIFKKNYKYVWCNALGFRGLGGGELGKNKKSKLTKIITLS